MKSVQIRSFSPYFPEFGLNKEEYLSVLSLNARKYGPEKLRIWGLFRQCLDKPLENIEKVAKKTLDIQETVKEVLATEAEYDGVHIQLSPDHTREVITSHVNCRSLLKTNFKEIKIEKLNDVFEEYKSQYLRTDVLKLQTDHEELWINQFTFYKKCMNDLGHLFKHLKVQLRRG